MTLVTKPFQTIEDIDARVHADRVAQTVALFEARIGLKASELGLDAIQYYVKQGKTPRQIVDEALRIHRPQPFA